MKIWKRIGAMAIVTAFSALALTGCGGGSSSGGGDSASGDGWNIGYVNLADTDVFCMARESALTTELDGTGYPYRSLTATTTTRSRSTRPTHSSQRVLTRSSSYQLTRMQSLRLSQLRTAMALRLSASASRRTPVTSPS